MRISSSTIATVIRLYFPGFVEKYKIGLIREDRANMLLFRVSAYKEGPVIKYFNTKRSDALVVSAIFHEMGHIVLRHGYTKESQTNNIQKRAELEADAQRWAILRAKRTGNLEVAKLLLQQFQDWRGWVASKEYNKIAKENEGWINKHLRSLNA